MRKTLFITIILATVISQVKAQTGKGNFYVGGNFNYNFDGLGTSSTTNYTTGTTYYTNNHIKSLQINPDLGFFLSDNWAVGIQPGYARVSGVETSAYYSKTNDDDNFVYVHHYHTDALSLGIHFRYYWMLNDKIGIFPQFGVTTAHDVNDFKSGTLSVGGNPNIVFFATQQLGINLGFGNLEYTYGYKTQSNTFNIGLNTNISFGINYYWGRQMRNY